MNYPSACSARLTLACLLALVLGLSGSSAHAADPKVRAVRVPGDGIHPQAQVDGSGPRMSESRLIDCDPRMKLECPP